MIDVGIHPDLSEQDYHGDKDSLSVSGAKKLIPPSCPAKFKYDRDSEDDDHSETFDVGKAVHALVLGKGAEVEVAPFEDWRSKAAREFRDEAWAEGKAVLLQAQYDRVSAVAASVKGHRLAAALLTGGAAEVSACWDDRDTGVRCRARFDYLPEPVKGRRLVVPDLKTALSSHPGEFGRASARFHYAMQDQWYSDALTTLGVDRDPAFVFIVVEKEPPYVVTVCQLGADDKQLGAALNRKARRIYADCLATDTWPGYAPDDEFADTSLPPWHHHDYEEFAFA